jgi:hypothetical protein
MPKAWTATQDTDDVSAADALRAGTVQSQAKCCAAVPSPACTRAAHLEDVRGGMGVAPFPQLGVRVCDHAAAHARYCKELHIIAGVPAHHHAILGSMASLFDLHCQTSCWVSQQPHKFLTVAMTTAHMQKADHGTTEHGWAK